MSEVTEIVEYEKEYFSARDFKLDLNKMDYGVASNCFQMDWNKLSYGNEQMFEFLLNKEEERLPSRCYEYLFKKPRHRTPMEIFYLKEKDVEIIDSDSSDEEESPLEKRLTIMYLEQTKRIQNADETIKE
jgi:hypothetical protein